MNYWLTTHWPPEVDQLEPFANTGAWVSDGKQVVLQEMRPGDLLFIYESMTGKSIVRTRPDGMEYQTARKKGRQGVVALVEITSLPANVPGKPPDRYSDGTQTWWRCKAEGRAINTNGFVNREALARILGHSTKYAFRGYGDRNSGLKRLPFEAFDQIRTAFVKAGEDPKKVLERRRSTGRGTGGEGPLHRSLKNFIAANPEVALNESGLRTIHVEYPFETGDRIDVVLKDRNGRIVTVEVEVDCDDREVCGPLQCMKYRALIAYLLERQVSEVRTILAARSITPNIRNRCSKYAVETSEIPAWPNSPDR